ncbi:hypothetical protein JK628_05775 [Shewanella sp. KX20019]|uniref:hypothetical protein n=1 Tax=Shewanella sp. KX20019 TaxID=2803864 RepID=UPI0019290FC0|nr:hypothetical protein [Shewanella sp. KX20019]QQX81372.1 hypothetical protein JK628_05775 [Shewanella sp. KX20019]
MSDNSKYNQPQLTTEDVLAKLTNTSPLQASRVLIDMELHDQRSSIEILEEIYDDFDTGTSVVDQLVTPIFYNIIDASFQHPKLKKIFQPEKHNLTPSKVITEVMSFNYSQYKKHENIDKWKYSNEDLEQQKNRHEYYGNKDSYNKSVEKGEEDKGYKDFRDNKKMDAHRDQFEDDFDEYRQENTAKKTHVDHILPGSKMHKAFKNLPLSDDDLKSIINIEQNYAMMVGGDNISKNDSTATQFALRGKKDNSWEGYSAEQKLRMFGKDVKAGAVSTSAAAGLASINQAKSRAVGDLILLCFKPLYFEISDIFKNGLCHDTGTDDAIAAIMFRFKRVSNFLMKEVIPFALDSLKSFFSDFVTFFFTALGGLVIALFTTAISLVIKGFKAIVEAIKIAFSKDKKLTQAQKADAILKLLATTVVTLVIEYFQEQLIGFLSGTPFEMLKDIITLMVSGVASSLVVYFLDKLDLFSTKAELRTQRVNEVFAMRIRQVKENTDAFEGASIEKLAKDRLQFRAISERMSNAIDNDENVNSSISDLADFMHIDLKVKSTDDFMHLLSKQETLVVN